jgi:hypothetical protein
MASVIAIASSPTTSGMTAAMGLPKASSRRASVAGMTSVEWDLSGEFELRAGVLAAELALQGRRHLVDPGDEGLRRAVVGRKPDKNKCSAVGEEDRVSELEIGYDARDAGLIPKCRDDGLERLAATGSVYGRKPLHHEDNLVDERGVEAGGKFILDGLRLAAFHASGGLEAALSVKREGNERKGGSKDDSGDPQATQMHGTHHVIDAGCH